MKSTASLRALAAAALLALAAGELDLAGASDDIEGVGPNFPGGLPPASQKRQPMKEVWPWYHSADEIHDRLSQLAGQCANANIDVSQRSEINSGAAAGTNVELDVVHISRSGDGPKTKAMLIFGEHARELISPETALNFVETLCGNGPDAKRASSVLDNVSFTIVPNANPLSRKLVEDGYYCKRTNEDGVDLNRNFGDTHRVAQGDEPGEEMNPGPQGFSEPESRIIKGLIDEERPEIYVSVHSGAYLMGLPYGYSSSRTPDNEANMLEVLRPISEKYCQGECPYGNLANLIHYENPGCDIDYVAEQVGSPYVFTWEIYVGDMFRQRYIDEARMQREQRGSAGGLAQQQEQESFVQKRQEAKLLRGGRRKSRGPEAKIAVESCINQFNPQSEEETKAVVSRWTGAFLELSEQVSAKKQKSQSAPQAATAASSASSLSLAFGSSAEDSVSAWDFK